METRSKVCFRCNENKLLSDYYTHKQMADGHLNKCKDCTKSDSKKRHHYLIETDHEWVESEKQRGRNKYHRLRYKDIHKPTPEQKKKAISIYKSKYPEKYKGRIALSGLKRQKGNELHHWSYKDEHLKDVIELSITEHAKAHRYMVYDPEQMMYRTTKGILLDTREAHEKYIESLTELP